jgi:CBS domain-containing protein
VVNNEQKLVGIIADRDILKRIINSVEDKTRLEHTPLEKLMTQPVLSASQDTNFLDIFLKVLA